MSDWKSVKRIQFLGGVVACCIVSSYVIEKVFDLQRLAVSVFVVGMIILVFALWVNRYGR